MHIKLPTRKSHQKHIIEWYDEYSMSLFKYILKIIKDVQQAEDLTQDTFIRAYTYISKENEVKSPKAFLYRIAHIITVDFIRKNKPIYMIKDFFNNKEDPGPTIELIVEIK